MMELARGFVSGSVGGGGSHGALVQDLGDAALQGWEGCTGRRSARAGRVREGRGRAMCVRAHSCVRARAAPGHPRVFP